MSLVVGRKYTHLTDKITGREIIFDYRLKSGFARSNGAIDEMKIIGIEIKLTYR